MNDRFKFRMYDTNVNKMYMPNDFEEVESIYECIKQQINWDLDVDYDIKFNHLEDGRFFMQSTGLKDKNGKLIYEGDFVRYLDYICEIIYKRGSFILEVRKGKKDGFFHFYDMHNSFLEVIGNKFENPEMLKECE